MNESYFKDNFKEDESFVRWYTEEELSEFERLDKTKSLVGSIEAYNRALEGDFSQFENVSPCARLYLASLFMKKNFGNVYSALDYGLSFDISDDDLLKYKFRPDFRLALSVKNPEFRKKFMEYDSYMNTAIMEDTLKPVTKEAFERLRGTLSGKKSDLGGVDAATEAFSENIDKQVMLAKVMLLAHLGNTYTTEHIYDEHKKETGIRRVDEYKESAANLFAHCSRVSVILPPGADTDVIKAIMGSDMGKATGIYKRMAATHDVKPRKLDANGNVIQGFEEIKAKPTKFTGQYGMDIPIGGLGNESIPYGKDQQEKDQYGVIVGDGTCGHMYVHVHEGNTNECGAMLIGFESDSPSAEGNQQGHTHSMRIPPKGERMSSFCAQRTDEIGAKYGGRVIDLSKVNPNDLNRVLREFEQHYRDVLVNTTDHENAGLQAETNNKALCGAIMNPEDTATLLLKLNVNKEAAVNVISAARGSNRENLMSSVQEPVRKSKKVYDPRPLVQAPTSDTEKREEYKHQLSNAVRSKVGISKKVRKSNKRVYSENIEKFNATLEQFTTYAALEIRERSDGLYNYVNETDRVYIRDTNDALNDINNISADLNPAAKALAEEMKRLSDEIAKRGLRISALEKMAVSGEKYYDEFDIEIIDETLRNSSRLRTIKEGCDRTMASFPKAVGEEFKAAAEAFREEALYEKAVLEKKFADIKHTLLNIEGKNPKPIESLNENYISSVLRNAGVDYSNIKGKKFKAALPDGVRKIDFGNSFRNESLEDWKSAREEVLEEVFRSNFMSDKYAMDNAEFLGMDSYDTIFINGKSMREYYKEQGKNPEDMRADVIKKLLNKEIQVEVVNYDGNYEAHIASVHVNSLFPEKKVPWYKRAPEKSENDIYAEYAENGSAERRSQISLDMKRNFPHLISKISKKKTAQYMADNVAKEESLLKARIINDIKAEKGTGDINDERNIAIDNITRDINLHEIQLYMLSKGMKMSEIMSLEGSKKRAELALEYLDLKSDPESKEYLSALKDMKAALAGAALPGADLSNGDMIINSLSQITWLKKASDIFVNNLGSEDISVENQEVERGIKNINLITGAQLEYFEYFRSKEFTNHMAFNNGEVTKYCRNKLFLQECERGGDKGFYSQINTDGIYNILEGNLDDRKFVRFGIGGWLNGEEEPICYAINKEGEGIITSVDEVILNGYERVNIDVKRDFDERGRSIYSEFSVLENEVLRSVEPQSEAMVNDILSKKDMKDLEISDIESIIKTKTDEIIERTVELTDGFNKRMDRLCEDKYYDNILKGKRDIINSSRHPQSGLACVYNAFPEFGQDETARYNALTEGERTSINNTIREFRDKIEDLRNDLRENLREAIESSLDENIRWKMALKQFDVSPLDRIEKDIFTYIADLDPQKAMISEIADNISTEAELSTYISEHPDVAKLYENVEKHFKKEFEAYDKELEKYMDGLNEMAKEGKKKTPALSERLEADLEYKKSQARMRHAERKIELSKRILNHCTERLSKETGVKFLSDEELALGNAFKRFGESMAREREEKKASEVNVEVPKKVTWADKEITDKITLEEALRAREVQYREEVSGIDNDMASKGEEVYKMRASLNLEPVEFSVKQREAYNEEFYKEKADLIKECRKEADKEARYTHKPALIERLKEDYTELNHIKHIKDIEKMGKTNSKFAEIAKAAREEVSHYSDKKYDELMEKGLRDLQERLFNKHLHLSYNDLEANIASREKEIDALMAKRDELRSNYEKDVNLIREKGKMFIEPEEPKKRSLKDFEKPPVKPEKSKDTALSMEEAGKSKGRVNEFLTPRKKSKGAPSMDAIKK